MDRHINRKGKIKRNKMKKKLIITGCSYSDKDYWTKTNNEDKKCDTWGEILAKELNMDFVCLAHNGSGNKRIYSVVQDYILNNNVKEIGLCIAGWSRSQRVDWQNRTLQWNNTKSNMYGNVKSYILESLRYMYAFQNLMEQHRIPYRHFQMIDLFTSQVFEIDFKLENRNFKKTINECKDIIKKSPQYKHIKNFIGWPIINEEGGFVLSDLQLHKDWGITDKLANNEIGSSFNALTTNTPLEEIKKNNSKKAPEGTINYDYVISKGNPHPNKKGHEWLAKYIKDKL